MVLIVLLFVAGQVAVAAAAVACVRMLRREPNLEGRRKAILDLNSKPLRIEASQKELAESKEEGAVLNRMIDKVKKGAVERVSVDDLPTTKVGFFLLGLILAEAEAVVFLILSASVGLLGLSTAFWAFLSPIVTAGWIVMLHVLIGAMVIDPHRPARSIRRAKLGTALTGAAVIVGFWLTLSGRNIADTNLVEQLAGMGVMILAALLSLAAAFCTTVVTTLADAHYHERELSRLERLSNRYAQHIAWLEQELRSLIGASSPEPEQARPVALEFHEGSTPMAPTPVPSNGSAAKHSVADGPRPRSASSGLIPPLGALLLFLTLPPLGLAQASGPQPSAAPSRVTSLGFARTNACEILIDLTGSVDRQVFSSTIAQTAAQLPLIVDALRCSFFRVTPFAGNLFTAIDEFDVSSGECVQIKGAVQTLYPKVGETQADVCKAQRRAKALDPVSQRLGAIAKMETRGPCTALPQAIQRALERSQHVITITDGVPSCKPLVEKVATPADGHLLFLLAPQTTSESPDQANAQLARMAALRRNYAGADVLLAPEATNEFWRRAASATR